MQDSMTRILLVGTELPLLEGLSQSFGALGFTPMVASTLHEGRELASQHVPLVAVISRKLAAESSGEMLSIPLSPGGALVLYSSAAATLMSLSPSVQRTVLAVLTLPLERNRLLALVQHVGERARATGRGGSRDTGLRAES